MNIRQRLYRVTVKHDLGDVSILIYAQSKKVAKQQVLSAEGCPARAIVAITRENDW